MSDPNISLERVIYVDNNIDEVWSRMRNARALLDLFPYAKLIDASSEDRGSVSIRNSTYNYTISKYAVRLRGRTAVGINLSRVGDSATKVHFAAVDKSGTYIPVIGSGADIFFANLRKSLEVAAPASAPKTEVRETKPVSREPAQSESRPARPKERVRSAPKAEARETKRSAEKKTSGYRFSKKGIIAMAALAVLLLVAILIVFHPFSGKRGGRPAESVSVNLSKACTLRLGMTPGEVGSVLGIDGKTANGITMYGNKNCVAVTYLNGTVSRIVIRNQANSITPLKGNVVLESPSLTTEDQIDFDTMEEAYGYKVSEIEKVYDGNGEESVRLHFGYIDPLANFDPNWRGEDVATITTSGSSVETWYRQSQMQGLLCGDKTGKPASYYTFFSDYLQDFYAYCSSMRLLNNYSRGDIMAVLDGTLTKYASYGALEMYDLVLNDPLAMMMKDGVSVPAYKITVSLNNGYFVNAMYCNMRFANDTSIPLNTYGVGRGISMTDIQNKIQRLPTAMLYDTSSIYLCWGAMREGNTIDEQFELVVRFEIENDLAANVYNNTALAAQAGTNLPASDDASSTP
ncbi:MAG: hypothetical protein IKE27_05685 [Oscillospiraceae bacterium]|nr:hypothetical protein [Oscillospiraceae bacterium]